MPTCCYIRAPMRQRSSDLVVFCFLFLFSSTISIQITFRRLQPKDKAVKIGPISIRIGVIADHDSRGFSTKTHKLLYTSNTGKKACVCASESVFFFPLFSYIIALAGSLASRFNSKIFYVLDTTCLSRAATLEKLDC